MLISLLVYPNNVFVDVVDGDSQTWENQYGKLTVYPATSKKIVRQIQYCNFTSYVDGSMYLVTGNQSLAVYHNSIWNYYEKD